MEEKLTHLGFIQAIVTRLGANSFSLKGWSATMVAATFALSAKDTDRNFIFVSISVVVASWVLDAYFLRQERLYRLLYDMVRMGSPEVDRLSLDVRIVDERVSGVIRTMVSGTLILFHGVLFALLCILSILG